MSIGTPQCRLMCQIGFEKLWQKNLFKNELNLVLLSFVSQSLQNLNLICSFSFVNHTASFKSISPNHNDKKTWKPSLDKRTDRQTESAEDYRPLVSMVGD